MTLFKSKLFLNVIVLVICALVFTIKTNAQQVTVINQKGTKINVINNLVTTSATAPTSPLIADVWFDTTTNETKVYNGTTWNPVGGVNTALSVVTVAGTDFLRLTDSKGNLDVPLTALGHSGTTGSVFFAGTNGQPTENNNQLFWNNSSNQLFVGNPSLSGSNKLNVGGTTRTSGLNNSDGTFGLPSYRFTDDSDTGMFRSGTNQLGFSTNGTLALNIDANQLVSIPKNLSVTGQFLDSSGDAGTSGQILSSTVTGTNWVDGKLATVKALTASYTLVSTDNGSVITIDNAGPTTLTIPSGLPIGFNVSLYQIGAGVVTITGSGTTLKNRLNRYRTAGKDAGIGIVSTATNIFHITGDLKL